jgi:hypothetical protein
LKTDRRRSRSLFALTLLAFAAASPSALGQTAKKPGKKKPKPAATETAPAEAPPPAPTPPPEPAPEPTPPPAPEPAPEASAPPKEVESASSGDDVTEKPGEKYTFVGVRYRGTIVPKFMLNLFVDEGKTIYSNQIGLEYEVRRDGFSMIPWLTYTEYGTGDMLFLQKGKDPNLPQWYSVVNSGLKAVYAGVDLLWSTDISKNVAIEYGGGAGIGFIFGTLTTDWADLDPTNSSPLVGSNGKHYIACGAASNAASSGCNPGNHQTPNPAKVGGYAEPNWFSGGSVPVFFPSISIPQIGVRVKPAKSVVLRANAGFSITGFFFGLSGSYGLPQKDETPSSK